MLRAKQLILTLLSFISYSVCAHECTCLYYTKLYQCKNNNNGLPDRSNAKANVRAILPTKSLSSQQAACAAYAPCAHTYLFPSQNSGRCSSLDLIHVSTFLPTTPTNRLNDVMSRLSLSYRKCYIILYSAKPNQINNQQSTINNQPINNQSTINNPQQ